MGFLKLSSELVRQKKVQIEHVFLTEYMPSAPADFLKVYLAGLSFAHFSSSPYESPLVCVVSSVGNYTAPCRFTQGRFSTVFFNVPSLKRTRKACDAVRVRCCSAITLTV